MPDIRIKQGQTLPLGFAFQNDDASACDMTGAEASAAVAQMGEAPFVTLPIALDSGIGGTGSVQVQDTTLWPIGQLRCDICVARGGAVLYTDTFPIYVTAPVTPRLVPPV